MNLNGCRLSLIAVVLAVLSASGNSLGQTVMTPGQVSVEDLSIPQLEGAARRELEAGRTGQAVQFLNLIISRDKDSREAHGMLGDIYWEAGEPLKAREHWQAVLKIHPSDFGANFGLGRLKLNSGSYRDVMYYLEIAERVAPPDKLAEVLIPLAQAYGHSGEFEKAKDAISRAIAKDPDNYEAQYVLTGIASMSAHDIEDFDQSDVEAQRLIDLANEKLLAQGVTLEGAQRRYSAYEMRLNVLRGYQTVLFEFKADGSRSEEPIAELRSQLANVTGRVVETMLNREDARRTLSYFDVVDLAKKVVELDGGANGDSLMTLAMLQQRTGDATGAVETFSKLLEIDPGNQAAKSALETLRPPTSDDFDSPQPSTAPAADGDQTD